MPTSNEIYIQKNTRTSHKRWESMVLYALHFALRNIRIESQYKVGIYFIDAFLPEANLAIEIDEEHHKLNKLNDMYRQSVIEKMIGCKFIRIDVEQDVYVLVLQLITGVSKKIKFQVYEFDPQSLEKADLRVTEPIRNTYRNIIGFEKGCSEEIAFDLITKIRNRIN